MFFKDKIILTLVLFLSFLIQIKAASDVDLKKLNQQAQSHSSVIAAYQEKILSKNYKYHAAKAQRIPDISLYMNGDYNGNLGATYGSIINIDLKNYLSNPAVKLRLELSKAKMSKILAQQAVYQKISALYVDLYTSVKLISAYQHAQGLFNKQIYSIKRMVRAGVDARLELDRALLQRNYLTQRLNELHRDIKNCLTDINSMTQADYTLKSFGFAELKRMDRQHNAQKIYSTDYFNSLCERPILMQKIRSKLRRTLLWQVQDLDVQQARAIYHQSNYYDIPALQIGGEKYHYQDSNPLYSGEYRVFVALSFNLNNLYTNNKIRKSLQQELRYQKDFLVNYERTYNSSAKKLLNRIQTAYSNWQIAKKNVSKCGQMESLAFDQYRKGRIRQIDVIDIFNQCASGKESMISRFKQYYLLNLQLSQLLREY